MSALPHSAAIVLCGGRGSRLGRPKFSLPFGGITLVERVVRRLLPAVARVVVAAAPADELPDLPGRVTVVRDPVPFDGPLTGLAAALGALPADTRAFFLCGCDLPWLNAEFAGRLLADLGAAEALVPVVGGRMQPLGAAYARPVEGRLHEYLAGGGRRVTTFVASLRSRFIDEETLAAQGFAADVLVGINTPEDYAAALARLSREEENP